jgi:hypothetical protein
VDLLIEQGRHLCAVEIKSGATVNKDFFKNLNQFSGRVAKTRKADTVSNFVVFGGENTQARPNAKVLSWRYVHGIMGR